MPEIRTIVINRGPAGAPGTPGAATFAALTDKATADLPAINTPLANALAAKAPLASPAFTGTVGAYNSGSGIGAEIESGIGIGATIYGGTGGAEIASESGPGAKIYSSSGTYHATFGYTGIDQSFVARVKGAFGWFRGAFTGRIQAPDTLAANSVWTLPDATGTLALTTDTAPSATAALGLKTASTTVSISSATAPTTGQVLTATGGSAATWQTPSGTTYSAGTGLTLTGTVFSVTAGTYAPARSIQTTSFTAAVGGRYTLNNTGGVASITDPTGTAAGQSYTVIMAAGTAQFNGAGTVFAASRFELIRSYNGSAWSTLSPLLSDTLTVGGNSWDGSILSGPQSFSSTTRPTSSGTGAPAATSLITRDDAMLLFGGRDLWPYCTISASANATAPRSTNGILSFDGTLSATAVSGNNLTVQVGNSLMSLDSYYDGASAVDSSKPWTIYIAASFLTVTNSELVFAVGATASSGVPASGTSAGFRISSAMLASVWRCTTGTVVESTPISIAASMSTAYAPTKKNHIWLRNNGSGSLSLYIAQPSTLRASKPDFATATLIGTVTGVSTASAPGISLSLRATGNTSAVSGLFFYGASYTEI